MRLAMLKTPSSSNRVSNLRPLHERRVLGRVNTQPDTFNPPSLHDVRHSPRRPSVSHSTLPKPTISPAHYASRYHSSPAVKLPAIKHLGAADRQPSLGRELGCRRVRRPRFQIGRRR